MTSQHTTAKNEAIELLPCPFCNCGSLIVEPEIVDKPEGFWWIRCEGCEAEINTQYSRIIAVEKWNTRAAIAHTRQENARLREALEQIQHIASEIEWPDEGREIATVAQNALSTGKEDEPLRAA
jgi:Lar family restriction alleviation protein